MGWWSDERREGIARCTAEAMAAGRAEGEAEGRAELVPELAARGHLTTDAACEALEALVREGNLPRELADSTRGQLPRPPAPS